MHGSSASNIYDSWRSTRHAEYYYDEREIYGSNHKMAHYPPQARYDPPPTTRYEPQFVYPYQQQHQHHHAPHSQAYSNSSRRYYRDYDPNF
jgi:hypothetical protein